MSVGPQGPFGPGAMGVPDLGQMAAEAEARQQGMVSFPMAVIEMLGGIRNEMAGVRVALTPSDDKHHLPCVMPVVDADGKQYGYGVYCLACSDHYGQIVYLCQLRDDDSDWPPQVLVVDPESAHAESQPQASSPDVPDDASEILED